MQRVIKLIFSTSISQLNANNAYVNERLHQLVENHLPNYKCCLRNTSAGYDKESCFLPGSVSSMTFGKLAGRFSGMGGDVLDRFTWMQFKESAKTLKEYTVYGGSQKSENNVGVTTAFIQQYKILNKGYLEELEKNTSDDLSKEDPSKKNESD